MAGKTGKCVVVTDLGVATHKYWHGSGQYFRQPLDNKTIGAIEVWTGTAWERAWMGDQATPHYHSLPNAVSIPHTP
jgi:hypothetical protein